MTDSLRRQLRTMGWRSSNRCKGFLQTWREGIEFHVGRRGESQIELRYYYRSPHGEQEGTVSLPADATSATLEQALTDVYRRVHERPLRRTLGGGSRNRAASPERGDAGQLGLDFSPDRVED